MNTMHGECFLAAEEERQEREGEREKERVNRVQGK
jgi:hypothetical protein